MSEIFFEQLGVPAPDHMLEVGSGSHAVQTAKVMERLEPLLTRDERPDLLLVPGDVNSTLAAALTAAKLDIPVGHIESGLRSCDREMPEEINRILTDQIADTLYVHSEEAIGNLAREGIARRAHPLRRQHDDRQPGRARGPLPPAGVLPRVRRSSPAAFLLVTLHRPALVDGPLLFEAISALNLVAADIPVLFPVHPRTRARLTGEVEIAPRPPPGRPGRLPRVPLPRSRRRRRPDRLRRHPGRDHLPRSPLLHPARQHRAPGHGRTRHQHPARPRPGPNRRNPRPDHRRRPASPPSPHPSGTARPPSESPSRSPSARDPCRLATTCLRHSRARPPRRPSASAPLSARRKRSRYHFGPQPTNRTLDGYPNPKPLRKRPAGRRRATYGGWSSAFRDAAAKAA